MDRPSDYSSVTRELKTRDSEASYSEAEELAIRGPKASYSRTES